MKHIGGTAVIARESPPPELVHTISVILKKSGARSIHFRDVSAGFFEDPETIVGTVAVVS